MERTQLLKRVLSRAILSVIFLMAIFFFPAGTLAYWQAWVYMAVLFLPLVYIFSYLIKNDPKLLERRMRTQEREKEQQIIVMVSSIFLILSFVLPGFDFRFGWSNVPLWLILVADFLVLAGYIFIFFVFRENQYTSRVVEVEKEQTVISSGPYAIVRHPMYLGIVIMYIFSPLALGSFWAIIPASFTVPILVFRLLNEEKVLERDLAGYTDYQAKVKYHLFPGIW